MSLDSLYLKAIQTLFSNGSDMYLASMVKVLEGVKGYKDYFMSQYPYARGLVSSDVAYKQGILSKGSSYVLDHKTGKVFVASADSLYCKISGKARFKVGEYLSSKEVETSNKSEYLQLVYFDSGTGKWVRPHRTKRFSAGGVSILPESFVSAVFSYLAKGLHQAKVLEVTGRDGVVTNYTINVSLLSKYNNNLKFSQSIAKEFRFHNNNVIAPVLGASAWSSGLGYFDIFNVKSLRFISGSELEGVNPDAIGVNSLWYRARLSDLVHTGDLTELDVDGVGELDQYDLMVKASEHGVSPFAGTLHEGVEIGVGNINLETGVYRVTIDEGGILPNVYYLTSNNSMLYTAYGINFYKEFANEWSNKVEVERRVSEGYTLEDAVLRTVYEGDVSLDMLDLAENPLQGFDVLTFNLFGSKSRGIEFGFDYADVVSVERVWGS